MRTQLVLTLAALAGACGRDAPDTARDLAAIRALHARDSAATLAADTAALMALWTDDIVSLQPGNPVQVGRAANATALRDYVVQSTGFRNLWVTFEFPEVQLFGDHAVEWGTFRGAVLTPAGDTVLVAGKLMRVLRRDSVGSWRIARTIFTSDPS
jgi:ketosteroid isomerase-like protein